MAFEVACSQCEGRLIVEEAGVIVACPHCGTHLNIEAPTESEASSEPEATTTDAPTNTVCEQSADDSENQPESIVEQTAEATDEPLAATDEPTEAVEKDNLFGEIPTEDDASLGTEDSPPVESPISVSADEITQPQEAVDSSPPFITNAGHDEQPASATQTDVESAEQSGPPSSTTNVTTTNTVAAAASSESVSVSVGRGVSRHTFSLVRNYAIAMTLAVIFLIYKLLNPNMSALESLPDVKPPKKDDKIVYKLVPEATEMPPGHRLALGQSQRFGNLQVTPVRVTKEPINFVHHQGNDGVSQAPTSDVVKLWFEFENLSTDQNISPLDNLVFKRDDNDWENVRSNNFVCRQSEKKKGGKLVFVFDHLINSEWNLRDQHVDVEIAPGERLETFIPTTEEGVAQLLNSDEPLVWRVQFRKGYSPMNYGVTTVIEVAFESSDIGAASPTRPETAEPEQEAGSAA